MKVLHVVNISFVLPYFIGDQFAYFGTKNIEFHVACTPSKHLFEYAEQQKYTPFPVKILRQISILEDIKSIIKLSKYIKENQIDIVIGHTPKGGFISMIAAYFSKVKKRIYFRHGIMFETSTGIKRQILIGIEKLAGRLATKVVCVSPSVLAVSNRLNLSNKSKNILLGKGTCNGVNIDFFSKHNLNVNQRDKIRKTYGIEKDDKVVGYVGRLVNDKGINELIDAWKLLLNKYNNIKLLLVGPFEERDSLAEELKAFITEHQSIVYTGLVIDVKNFYSVMDIFILPSRREGFPTVVLEASAMGLPVITTFSTGCVDSIIDGKTGLFAKLDPIDISMKITEYLNDPEKAKKHGENGREFVAENFDQRIIWEQIDLKIFN